jgi:hypothetical protein
VFACAHAPRIARLPGAPAEMACAPPPSGPEALQLRCYSVVGDGTPQLMFACSLATLLAPEHLGSLGNACVHIALEEEDGAPDARNSATVVLRDALL